MRNQFDVEVFPVAAERWIAVIETPDGPFSTEAEEPAGVIEAVQQAILQVTGHRDPVLRLHDERQEPWSVSSAARQLRDLG